MVVLAYNFLGDGLRDALDPRLRISNINGSLRRRAVSRQHSATQALQRLPLVPVSRSRRRLPRVQARPRSRSRPSSKVAGHSGAGDPRPAACSKTCLVISLHDHAFVVPEDPNQIFEYRRAGRDWTGYEGLAVSGMDAIFDCLMDGTAVITSKAGWKWDDIILDLGMRLTDIAHQDMVIRAETTEDIVRAKRTVRSRSSRRSKPPPNRKRAGPPGHPVRLRHPLVRYRVQRGQHARQRTARATRRRADRVRSRRRASA